MLAPSTHAQTEAAEPAFALHGELRVRVDAYSDTVFGSGDEGFESLQYRGLVRGIARLADRISITGELGAFEESGRDVQRPADDGGLDITQFYIEFNDEAANSTWGLRLGRQEISLGRFISVGDFLNMRRTFEAARFTMQRGHFDGIAIVGRPTANRTGTFDDRGDREDTIYALVFARSNEDTSSRATLILLHREFDRARFAEGRGNERRTSLGIGHRQQWGAIDVDINGALQTGELRTDGGEMLDIAAWGVATEIGWRPHDTLRLAMRIDAASGDSEADEGKLETFDLPYPSNAYLSDACIFMPRNGHDLQFLASIRPFERLQLTVGSQFMWRMETSDAIYAPGGAVVLDPGGSDRALATSALWPRSLDDR